MPKRPGKLIEFNGKCQSTVEWAKELGNISLATLYYRLRKFPLEKALSTEKLHKGGGTKGTASKNAKPITFNGKTLTITQWCNELGVGQSTLGKLLKRCSSEKEAMNACFWIGVGNKEITFNEQTLTVSEWARQLDLSVKQLYKRLKKLPLEKAMRK